MTPVFADPGSPVVTVSQAARRDGNNPATRLWLAAFMKAAPEPSGLGERRGRTLRDGCEDFGGRATCRRCCDDWRTSRTSPIRSARPRADYADELVCAATSKRASTSLMTQR